MLRHPAVEYLLAGVGEGIAATTAYPPYLDIQLLAQQTSKDPPKRRARRIAGVSVSAIAASGATCGVRHARRSQQFCIAYAHCSPGVSIPHEGPT